MVQLQNFRLAGLTKILRTKERSVMIMKVHHFYYDFFVFVNQFKIELDEHLVTAAGPQPLPRLDFAG